MDKSYANTGQVHIAVQSSAAVQRIGKIRDQLDEVLERLNDRLRDVLGPSSDTEMAGTPSACGLHEALYALETRVTRLYALADQIAL